MIMMSLNVNTHKINAEIRIIIIIMFFNDFWL